MRYVDTEAVVCARSLTLLLEFFAFLRLKYVEKDTERPFSVPFGNTGAWAITLPKVIVLGGVMFAQSGRVWLFCGAFNAVVSIAYLVWRRFQPADRDFGLLSSSSPERYGSIKHS